MKDSAGMVGEYLHYPTIPDDSTGKYAGMLFEEKMLRTVNDDFASAQQNMAVLHEEMLLMHKCYYNANEYESIRADHKFPVPYMQQQIDKFVCKVKKSLVQSGRIATVVGMEGTDPKDVNAKQEMLDWQDYVNDIDTKLTMWIRDTATFRFCVGAIDYLGTSRRKWVQDPVIAKEQQVVVDPESGQVAYDEQTGEPLTEEVEIDTGEKEWKLVNVPYFQGAWRRRVDPMNVFFNAEKVEMNDDEPLMVRDFYPKRHFYSESYFFNQDLLTEAAVGAEDSGKTLKRMQSGLSYQTQQGRMQYVEWYGLVDAKELYDYLINSRPYHMSDEDYEALKFRAAEYRPNERCWVICGVANGTAVVRLQPSPFPFDGPPLRIGYISPDGDELVGQSISMKVFPVHMAKQEIHGWILENVAQVVNAGWIIDKSALAEESQTVNTPGFTLFTNGDVNKAVRRVDLQMVAPDLKELDEKYSQMGDSSIGMEDIISGRGDRAVETLGEAEIVSGEAQDLLREFVRCFETTFIRPFYQMTNETNMAFIDEEFAYMVVADKTWKRISPAQVRADVDFLCDGASREGRKAVVVQQILQTIKVSSVCIGMGIPVRVDKMMAELWRTGFGWSEKKIEEYFPLIKFERENPGANVDQMLVMSALAQMNQARVAAVTASQMPAPGGPPPNGPTPAGDNGPMAQPRTEGEAVRNANQAARPTLRRMEQV